MSDQHYFIVGSLRQGSFNHQMASKLREHLLVKPEVSYLDYSALPLFSEIWKFKLSAVAAARARFSLRMLSGSSLASLQLLYPWYSEELA